MKPVKIKILCPVCGYDGKRKGGEDWKVVRCFTCGFPLFLRYADKDDSTKKDRDGFHRYADSVFKHAKEYKELEEALEVDEVVE